MVFADDLRWLILVLRSALIMGSRRRCSGEIRIFFDIVAFFRAVNNFRQAWLTITVLSSPPANNDLVTHQRHSHLADVAHRADRQQKRIHNLILILGRRLPEYCRWY